MERHAAVKRNALSSQGTAEGAGLTASPKRPHCAITGAWPSGQGHALGAVKDQCSPGTVGAGRVTLL